MENLNITPISKTAKALVGARFNPSDRPVVWRMKRLIAEFITECEQLRDAKKAPELAKMSADEGIKRAKEACVWGITAAVADLMEAEE